MSTAELATRADDELARLAAAGDGGAVEVLLQRHAGMAVALACTILADRDEALDAAQTALLQLAQELVSDWRGRPFKVCLYTRTRQVALRLLSQKASRKRRQSAVAAYNATKDAEMPGQQIERAETLQALREELASLPEEAGSLLTLYHLEGLPVAEIAGQLRVSVDACKQRLVRSREELRQRLERRGVCLGALAVLEEMLDQAFSTGKALAATIESGAAPQLAAKAAASVGLVVISGSTDLLSTQTAFNSGSNLPSGSSLSAAGRQGPVERIVTMVRKHPIAVSAGGLALVVLACLFVTSEEPMAASENSVANKAAGVAKEAAPALVRSRGTPKWQTPRIIEGSYEPVWLDVCGREVVLLAREHLGNLPDTRLVLFRSGDCGQNWEARGEIKAGYRASAAAIDAAGDCHILAEICAGEGPGSKVIGRRADWYRQTAALNAPEHLGSVVNMEKAGILFGPRVLRAGETSWTFWYGAASDALPIIGIRVGTSDNGAVPRAQTFLNARPCYGTVAAWAQSGRVAGVVGVSRDLRSTLQHFKTQDGGASWEAQTVPVLVDDSEPVTDLRPIALAHANHKLVLLLQPEKITRIDANSYKAVPLYMLVSNDLGQTWSKARLICDNDPFSLRAGRRASVSISGKRIFVSLPTLAGVNKTPDVSPQLLCSDNDGESWKSDPALHLGLPIWFVISAGDAESFHLAIGGQHEGKPYLILRSFCSGQWQEPQRPAPAWLKEGSKAQPVVREQWPGELEEF